MRLISSIISKTGKRHLELSKSWLPSGIVYGASAFIGLLYFTDWKVVVTKIPIYNLKFKEE